MNAAWSSISPAEDGNARPSSASETPHDALACFRKPPARYPMADHEQQNELAVTMEEALGLLLALRSGHHAA